MSSSAADPKDTDNQPVDTNVASPAEKGKGKVTSSDEVMEEEDEEEDDIDVANEEEEEEEEEEDSFEEIDPSAIVGRRTRNVPRVDYTSVEALEKAGLTGDDKDDEDDADVVMKD